MEHSTELRWFVSETLTDIERWFRQHNKVFKNAWERSDFYLRLDGYPKLSLKIREGKIEIKKLVHDLGSFKIPNICEGRLQQWIKWSKPLVDSLSPNKIFQNKSDVIEVKKERLLIKYEILENIPVVTNKNPSEGCQIELTPIGIDNTQLYSFAFEAYGDTPEKQMHNLKIVVNYAFALIDTGNKLTILHYCQLLQIMILSNELEEQLSFVDTIYDFGDFNISLSFCAVFILIRK